VFLPDGGARKNQSEQRECENRENAVGGKDCQRVFQIVRPDKECAELV
jgi:hypothetical protein